MSATGLAVFKTAIGPCGLAWGEHGVLGVHLPDSDAATTQSRLARRFPEAAWREPPPDIQDTIDGIVALLEGEPRSLADAPLDMAGLEPFRRQVYNIARAIPPGETLTYGEIASRLGDRTLAREVGQALGANPFPIIVPCHRVLGADGKVGGFSAPGGVATKMRMLSIERARTDAAPSLFDDLPLAAAPRRRNPPP